MAHALRDMSIQNIDIDIAAIELISGFFSSRLALLNSTNESEAEVGFFLTYIIRFDNKGKRLFSFNELKKNFEQAKNVERIIFTLESRESLASNRATGTFMELYLDSAEQSRCALTVTSNDNDWVDACFSEVSDLLKNFSNKNGVARTAVVAFLVQIFGVFLGFVLCLWGALKVSPILRIDNQFVISFLFLFLIFSNSWTYIAPQIMRGIFLLFPNLRFVRRKGVNTHWMYQAVVGSTVFAFMMYVLGAIGVFVVNFFSGFIVR